MMAEIVAFINSVGGSGLTLGFGILACLVSFFVLLHNHKKNQKITQKLLRLERELHVAQGSAIGMGQQLILMEKKLTQQNTSAYVEVPAADTQAKNHQSHHSVENHTEVSRENTQNDDSIYDQARRSLAQGLSIEDVAKQCGLSYAEVSLLHSLSKSTLSSC